LSDPNPDDSTREAVIAGCEDVYGELLGWLASASYDEKISQWQDVLTRISRVVDATAPQELMAHANSILELALPKGDKVPDVIGATVRACMGYKDRSMLPVWERIIDKYADVAAYAFNALLNIDPNANRIEVYLATLWRQQVINNWPVDTPFLMRRAARVRDDPNLVYRMLAKLAKEEYWHRVKKEMRGRSWSKKWLEGFSQWKVGRDLLVREKKPAGKRREPQAYPEPVDTFYIDFIGRRHHYQFVAVKSEPSNFYLHERTKEMVRIIGGDRTPREWAQLVQEISNGAEFERSKDRDERIRPGPERVV
jgi:hypothetical protein